MRGLAVNFASTHQTENPRGFSEVGENKQLLIAIVSIRFYFLWNYVKFCRSVFVEYCGHYFFSNFSRFVFIHI
ncbi:MAG: hypothetical protein CMC76_12495 [Flavobacteriaceae bacterium]|nr:hypothetical protein [Flavobacteriaceae bacterium]